MGTLQGKLLDGCLTKIILRDENIITTVTTGVNFYATQPNLQNQMKTVENMRKNIENIVKIEEFLSSPN